MAPLPRSATWSFSAALGSAARSGSAVWRSERSWTHTERSSHGLLSRRTLRRAAFLALAALYALALLSAASGGRAPSLGGRGPGGRRAGAAADGPSGGAVAGGGVGAHGHDVIRDQATDPAAPGRDDGGVNADAGRVGRDRFSAAHAHATGLQATGRWALARGAASRAHDGEVTSISSLFSSLRGAGARGSADAEAASARASWRGAGQQALADPNDPLVTFRDEGFLVPLSEALDVERWEPEHVYDVEMPPRRLRRAVRRGEGTRGADQVGGAEAEGAAESAPLSFSPETCPTGPVRVLIGIASRCCVASARAKRAALREAWAGGVGQEWPEGAQVRFFVSQPPLGATPEASAKARREAVELLREEIAEHGDLVVLPGEDGYRELPVKTLQLFRHGLESPCNYTHVAKIDDDVYLRVDNLRKTLETGAHEWDLPIEAPGRGADVDLVFDGRWAGDGPEPSWALSAKRPRATEAAVVDHAGLLGAAMTINDAQLLPDGASQAGDSADVSSSSDALGARRALPSTGARAPVLRADGAPGVTFGAVGASGGLAAPGGVETPDEGGLVRGQTEGRIDDGSAPAGSGRGAASVLPASLGGAPAASTPWLQNVYLGAVDSNRSGTFPGWGPLRDPHSKWYLSEAQLSDAQAQDLLGVRWISGWAYVLSTDLVRTVLDEAHRLGSATPAQEGSPPAELAVESRAAPDPQSPKQRVAAQGISSSGDPRAALLVDGDGVEALTPSRDPSAFPTRPLWWGRMPWEDVLVARLLRDRSAAPISHSVGFKASWDACDERTIAKHLDVDAPKLVPGLRAQELSGLWRHKEVVCSSANADVGDYAAWRAWRNGLGDASVTGFV